MAVQGYLILGPLWSRDLPPEVDDSLAYLVRTQELQECFAQDCLALQDLRKQLFVSSSDPEVSRQRLIAAFPFPFYHPLFSSLLLLVNQWTKDLITALKVVWSLAPLFFGVGLAYLLATLWGKAAAGIALSLLAFKVFPGNGLHYLTPSNVAMGAALFVWARILSRRGDAPWTLVIGSVVLLGIHPIGGVYAIVAALWALSISVDGRRMRIWVAVLAVFLILCLSLVLSSAVHRPSVFDILGYLGGFPGIAKIVKTYLTTTTEVLAQIVTMKEGLFGSFPFFCLAIGIGYFVSPEKARSTFLRTMGIYAVLLFGALYHTDPLCQPGELFLRMWIPAAVVFYGLVGTANWYTLKASLRMLKDRLGNPQRDSDFSFQKAWPAVVFAILTGFSLEMVLSGSEQVYATREYMTNRQALAFDPSQPKKLLSQARPGDRVLYQSTMIMGFYFVHGAMGLGAVYYHPVLEKTRTNSQLLKREDLRFVVAYNPTVYHPSLEGLDEKNKCITNPEYRFSPLSEPRKYGPISREGFIPAVDFRWLQVDAKGGGDFRSVRLLVRNPGKTETLELFPMDISGNLLVNGRATATVKAKWSGWVEFHLKDTSRANLFRIILPKRDPKLHLGGIALDKSGRHWPWAQRADLVLLAKEPGTGKVVLSFDPANILPPPLKNRRVTVLDDRGSSVLFRIEP
jgi:hypothetical protein